MASSADDKRMKEEENNKVRVSDVVDTNEVVKLTINKKDSPVISTVNVRHFGSNVRQEMRGLTVVDDKLYMLHQRIDPNQPSRVYVHDSQSLAALAHINIPNLEDAQGFAGCSHHKVLYIGDLWLRSIHRVNLTDNKVTCWRLKKGEHHEPLGINYFIKDVTVTLECNVLVTVFKGTNRLLEYTSEGLLIREIYLDENIKWVKCTVQFSNVKYIVSHDTFQKLCITNSEGQIVKNFVTDSGKNEDNLKFPSSLAIDYKNEMLFVADEGKSKIIILSTDLVVLGQVPVRELFSLSLFLYFDSLYNQLFIGYRKIAGIIEGLAVVDDKIYVAYSKSGHLEVYDALTLKILHHINIPGLKHPQSLTSCSRSKVLYISDKVGLQSCIHRFSLADNTVKFWNLKENHAPRGLSMTKDQNILVTVSIKNKEVESLQSQQNPNDDNTDSDDLGESVVTKYTSEGQLIKEIKLDKSIQWAFHTVELSADQLIICHGFSFSRRRGRVCVINSEGQIIKSYGKLGTEGEGRMNNPCSLAIDIDSELVFVADCYNKRVLVVGTDMTLLGQIQASVDIRYVMCVCLDSNSERLIIGDINGRLWIVCKTDQWMDVIKAFE